MKKNRDKIDIAVLGPSGTFSHMAANEIFCQEKEFRFTPTIEQVFEKVDSDGAEFGVVPIENYTSGLILETLDCILEYDLKIIGSYKLKINHNLLASTEDIGKIKKIKSHPQILSQCRRWLSENFPDIEPEPQSSSTRGISENPRDESIAFIGSKENAKKYGLKILAESIEDRSGNTTEFYVLAKDPADNLGGKLEPSKTLLLVSIKDKPGILRDILTVFADRDLNLTKLHSRALDLNEKKGWDYYFFLEVDCLQENDDFRVAIEKLEGLCSMIKVFGVS